MPALKTPRTPRLSLSAVRILHTVARGSWALHRSPDPWTRWINPDTGGAEHGGGTPNRTARATPPALHPTDIDALMTAGLLSCMPSAPDDPSAVVVLTEAGRMWLDSMPRETREALAAEDEQNARTRMALAAKATHREAADEVALLEREVLDALRAAITSEGVTSGKIGRALTAALRTAYLAETAAEETLAVIQPLALPSAKHAPVPDHVRARLEQDLAQRDQLRLVLEAAEERASEHFDEHEEWPYEEDFEDLRAQVPWVPDRRWARWVEANFDRAAREA